MHYCGAVGLFAHFYKGLYDCTNSALYNQEELQKILRTG